MTTSKRVYVPRKEPKPFNGLFGRHLAKVAEERTERALQESRARMAALSPEERAAAVAKDLADLGWA